MIAAFTALAALSPIMLAACGPCCSVSHHDRCRCFVCALFPFVIPAANAPAALPLQPCFLSRSLRSLALLPCLLHETSGSTGQQGKKKANNEERKSQGKKREQRNEESRPERSRASKLCAAAKWLKKQCRTHRATGPLTLFWLFCSLASCPCLPCVINVFAVLPGLFPFMIL